MPPFSEKELLDLNQQGLVPGPDEDQDQFHRRAEYCLQLRSHLEKELGKALPFPAASESSSEGCRGAFEKTKDLYDIVPDWIPVFYSDYQLTLWQGGCAWIFQEKTDSPKGALMQMRQRFREKDTYLGIYHKQELAAHEFAHAGRMCFEQPMFEELIAYRSSETAFRRWFGPIVKSSFESVVFVVTLVIMVLMDLSLVTMGRYDLYGYMMWTKLVPAGMVLWALVRLWRRHSQFNGCLSKLRKITSNPNGVIYRLTDEEIIKFSKMPLEHIQDYVKQQSSLRWKVITEAYF